ncbi:MAG: S41 family peptidase [Zoogloeaceae bacterium]|jgi:carboxyl-terminal processing protease|nr:S41 family peptidase [Zoogloeaceae bacterium]
MKSFKLQSLSLLALGILAGLFLGLQLPAFAERQAAQSGGLPLSELRAFAEVYGAISRGYVEPVEDKKLLTNAISGMLSNLDPHSAYLDPTAFKDLQEDTQGEFGGLGIEVTMEDGLVKVIAPIEDTPAYRAGLSAGDLIFKLDDTPVKGLTLTDAVKKMRGKPGTSLRLSILRKGQPKPLEITLKREVIKVQSVKSKLIEPGYGWLRITQFQDSTVADLNKHLKKLYEKGDLKGLILDLRNDPGGLLTAAVGVSSAFLPAGAKVVSTDGRVPEAHQEFLARPEDYERSGESDPLAGLPAGVKTVPMIVLVNGGSASASEIVAGALKDHERGLIMGTRTFGKGSVQTIWPLATGDAIKLTTARYYTPSGHSIQAKGIAPDIEVTEIAGGKKLPMLREADLTGHLAAVKDAGDDADADKKDADEASLDDLPPVRLEYATDNDRQFREALNLLKGMAILSRKPVAKPVTAAQQDAAPVKAEAQ